MELTQVGRRIVIQHWRLIAACVAVAVIGVLILKVGQSSSYTAEARLALDAPDPTTRQEAAAIADTAKGLATSPGNVRDALRKAGVKGRDPDVVARDDVTVANIGGSGLVTLSVSDRSPQHAAAIANDLAAAVIRTRLGLQRASSTVLADLDRRLTDLRERISRAGKTGSALQSLTEQERVLESERISLLTAAASTPRPAIVSAASPPAHADSSNLAVDLVLALLLGLVLGVGLAGLREMLRPTVVGGDAVAREFDAPLLGTLPSAPDQEGALTDLTPVTNRLSLAMGAARLPGVSLLAAGPEIDLRPLAAQLDAAGPQTPVAANVPVGVGSAAAAPSGTPGVSETPEHDSDSVYVHAADAGPAESNGHAIGGIVVVAPSSMTMTEVTETTQLLRLSSSPVIGAITYDQPRAAGSRR